jgi:predicted Fe-S protein YdhL (DUF1289 family)
VNTVIETPCVRLCTLDQRDTCVGCKRTRTEIMRWRAMSDAERRRIMVLLPSRP